MTQHSALNFSCSIVYIIYCTSHTVFVSYGICVIWYLCHTVFVSYGICFIWYLCHMVFVSYGICVLGFRGEDLSSVPSSAASSQNIFLDPDPDKWFVLDPDRLQYYTDPDPPEHHPSPLPPKNTLFCSVH